VNRAVIALEEAVTPWASAVETYRGAVAAVFVAAAAALEFALTVPPPDPRSSSFGYY
jgi:hypothetical protein